MASNEMTPYSFQVFEIRKFFSNLKWCIRAFKDYWFAKNVIIIAFGRDSVCKKKVYFFLKCQKTNMFIYLKQLIIY